MKLKSIVIMPLHKHDFILMLANVFLKIMMMHNGQKKKDKRTNNDLQNIHRKLKIE
jgi:hypothetical protein